MGRERGSGSWLEAGLGGRSGKLFSPSPLPYLLSPTLFCSCTPLMHTRPAGSGDSLAPCNTSVTRVACLKCIPNFQSSRSRGRPWDLCLGPLNDSDEWGPQTTPRTTSPERKRFL